MAKQFQDKNLTFTAQGDIKIEKFIKVERGAVYNDGGEVTMNVYGEEKKIDNNPAPASDPLSAELLRPYIDAGMLDENLMPADELSRGETAVLAHDIAERLGLQRFWPIFEQRWGIKYLSSDYNHFTKTAKFVEFQRRLNKIK